jgi:pSer/pThr/pTyr-binding forkhead associated (FHA) protein
LMVRTGPSAGMRFEIKRPRLVIGRRSIQSNAEFNTPLLQLNDPHVSRYHLAIVARPDGVYAHDIGSANGTWINGRQLGGEPVRLENGAELQLGPDSQLNFLAF